MNEKQTYTIVSDDLCQVVGANGAVICGKIASLCGEKNTPCEISHSYFCRLLGIDVRTLRRILADLRQVGYIEYKKGDGRGHTTTYKRGTNMTPFFADKGGQKCSIKGDKNAPLKIYYENIGGGAHAHARTSVPSPSSKDLTGSQGDTPCNPQSNTSMNYPFEKFWADFKVAPEFEYEKQSCERQWALLSDLYREDIMKFIHSRKKRNPNPHWFLYDYKSDSLRLRPVGAIVSHDEYYKFYGHDLPTDGWVFEKPAGYDRFVFVKKEATA